MLVSVARTLSYILVMTVLGYVSYVCVSVARTLSYILVQRKIMSVVSLKLVSVARTLSYILVMRMYWFTNGKFRFSRANAQLYPGCLVSFSFIE